MIMRINSTAKLLSRRPSRSLTDYETASRISEQYVCSPFRLTFPGFLSPQSTIVCPFRLPWRRSFKRDGCRGVLSLRLEGEAAPWHHKAFRAPARELD